MLYYLEEVFSQWTKTCSTFDLPAPSQPNPHAKVKLIQNEIDYDEEALQKVVEVQARSLNRDQKRIFSKVKRAVDQKKPLVAFIDGPGGSGKQVHNVYL